MSVSLLRALAWLQRECVQLAALARYSLHYIRCAIGAYCVH